MFHVPLKILLRILHWEGINKVLLKNITMKITKAAYTSAYTFLLYVL